MRERIEAAVGDLAPHVTMQGDGGQNADQDMEVVIFDGVCHLCTGSVQFIVRHEAAPTLMFAPMQSGVARALLAEHDVPPDAVDSMLLVSGRNVYVRSSAALRVARHLRGGWRVLRVLWLVPSPVRDWLYDFVAEHRYRWFGKAESCMVPTPELRARFLIDGAPITP